MKSKLISIILLLIIVGISIAIYKFNGEIFTSMQGLVNSQPQQYYGATVDMSQILPESKHYIVTSKGEDLIDLASELGMNTLRITNIASIKDSTTSSYTHEQWAEVLDKMKTKNMYAVVLVEANAQDAKFNRTVLDDYYVQFVKDYIVPSTLCSFPNVLGIDVANEPIINNNNLTRIKEATRIVKSTCPNARVTIGSWGVDSGEKDSSGKIIYYWHDPRAVVKLDTIVDFYSVHIYGFDKMTQNTTTFPDPYKFTVTYLNAIRKYTKKPILIEEFGAGNGSSITDQNTLGSETLQKNVYEGVLKASYDDRNKGVIGAIGYLFSPRFDKPDGWSITKDNGNILLPAAYTFENSK